MNFRLAFGKRKRINVLLATHWACPFQITLACDTKTGRQREEGSPRETTTFASVFSVLCDYIKRCLGLSLPFRWSELNKPRARNDICTINPYLYLSFFFVSTPRARLYLLCAVVPAEQLMGVQRRQRRRQKMEIPKWTARVLQAPGFARLPIHLFSSFESMVCLPYCFQSSFVAIQLLDSRLFQTATKMNDFPFLFLCEKWINRCVDGVDCVRSAPYSRHSHFSLCKR